MAGAIVTAVHKDSAHRFSKKAVSSIQLRTGHGVEGDAHSGKAVQHLSRVRADPSQPNLRQVHLMHQELLRDLSQKGFGINPGDLGENITTTGVDLLGLGRDTLLKIGPDVVLRVTGLRNPCAQIEAFSPGLLKHVAVKSPQGIIRKAGIMSVVEQGGRVQADDTIAIMPPEGPRIPLAPV